MNNKPGIFGKILLCSLVCILVTGCSTSRFSGTEGDPSKAVVGIMYSHSSRDRTIIQWLDDEQNVVGTSKYPYSSAIISFENANVEGERICLAPLGPFGKSDEKNVAIINTSDGSFREIELPTDNHQSSNNEGDIMVVCGNSNGEGYIDLIDLKTDDVKTYTDSELWDEGIMQVILVNGRIYGQGSDSQRIGVYRIDVDNKTLERVYQCKDNPQIHSSTYLCRHNDDLVFLDDKKLIKYDTKTAEIESFELTRDDYNIVNIEGDRIWLGYTDQHSSEYDSLIEVREYDSGKIIDRVDVDGSIWQIALANDTAYLLLGDFDKAKKLTLRNGKLEFAADILFDRELEKYSYGGIFAL